MVKLGWVDAREHVTWLYMRASWEIQGLSMASSVRLFYECRKQIEVKGKCLVGAYSVILTSASKEAVPAPLLIIGDNVYIGDQVNIRAAGGVIKIGRDVLIANQVTIVASNHGMQLGKPMMEQAWQRGDVIIEEDVWIGAGVVILPGAIIRQGSVIGAGAVVRGEVPANKIYGGIPARQIGERS
jgi:acetyltransferase-like isoleucine patch superfamily enzyme